MTRYTSPQSWPGPNQTGVMRSRAVPDLQAASAVAVVYAAPSILMSGLVDFTDIWMRHKALMSLRDRAEERGVQARATKDPSGVA